MTPHRVIGGHAYYGYLKVALVVTPLIVLAILANNEYTDRRVREVARETASFQVAATRYAVNRSACGAYTLVDPTIRTNETLLAALDRSIADPKTSREMLKINKARRASVAKQLRAFKAYRSLYSTIPPDFDCKTLPKKPPK